MVLMASRVHVSKQTDAAWRVEGDCLCLAALGQYNFLLCSPVPSTLDRQPVRDVAPQTKLTDFFRS